jgi:hypothetical protein
MLCRTAQEHKSCISLWDAQSMGTATCIEMCRMCTCMLQSHALCGTGHICIRSDCNHRRMACALQQCGRPVTFSTIDQPGHMHVCVRIKLSAYTNIGMQHIHHSTSPSPAVIPYLVAPCAQPSLMQCHLEPAARAAQASALAPPAAAAPAAPAVQAGSPAGGCSPCPPAATGQAAQGPARPS